MTRKLHAMTAIQNVENHVSLISSIRSLNQTVYSIFVKVVHLHAMMAHGKLRYSPTHFNLGSRWKWAVNFVIRPLYARWTNPRYPLNLRLNGPLRQSGGFAEIFVNHLLPAESRLSSPNHCRCTDYTFPAKYRHFCRLAYYFLEWEVNQSHDKSYVLKTRFNLN